MSIPTIPVDGGRIAYRRLGSGRTLLVLNGLAATGADWDPSFIDGLAAASELVLLDNRGIGASSDHGAPFDIRQLADDTARVIEALEFERASVLGWSLGGFIAQTLALGAPGPHRQTHPALHGSGRSRCQARLTRRPVATGRHVWHTA